MQMGPAPCQCLHELRRNETGDVSRVGDSHLELIMLVLQRSEKGGMS